MGLLGCYPDRLRVHGVCLVAQQEGFDVLGRQQLGLVGISDQRDRWFRYRDRGFRPIVTDSVVGSS
jgi:hypothetical protein